MFFVACDPVLLVALQRCPKTGATELASAMDILGPGKGPADAFNEAASLAERKVYASNPRTKRCQRCLNFIVARPFF